MEAMEDRETKATNSSPASATKKEPGIDTKSVPGLFFICWDISVYFVAIPFIFTQKYSVLCLSIRNCIKRAPKSTVPGQHRFGFEKPRFCSL